LNKLERRRDEEEVRRGNEGSWSDAESAFPFWD
jgi:hypothetical protein